MGTFFAGLAIAVTIVLALGKLAIDRPKPWNRLAGVLLFAGALMFYTFGIAGWTLAIAHGRPDLTGPALPIVAGLSVGGLLLMGLILALDWLAES